MLQSRCKAVGLTFFRSAARGLYVPGKLTPESTKREARKRRPNERPRVACCEEFYESDCQGQTSPRTQVLLVVVQSAPHVPLGASGWAGDLVCASL